MESKEKINQFLKIILVLFLLVVLVKNTNFLLKPTITSSENFFIKAIYLLSISPLIALYVVIPLIIIYLIFFKQKKPYTKVLIILFLVFGSIHFGLSKLRERQEQQKNCVQIVKTGPSTASNNDSNKRYINVTVINRCRQPETVEKLKVTPYQLSDKEVPIANPMYIDLNEIVPDNQELSFDVGFVPTYTGEHQRVFHKIEIVQSQ